MLSDLRLTFRLLAKTPGFTAIAIFTLAVGIGLNTATFSLIKAYVLADLPLVEPHRLIYVGQRLPDSEWDELSIAEFLELRTQQTTVEDLGAFSTANFELTLPDTDPVRVWGAMLSASIPPALRIAPQLGRWFNPEDDRAGAPPTAVLSDKLWRRLFNADPGIIGRQIKVTREWTTVVGVAAPGFEFHNGAELWLPWRFPVLTDEARDHRRLGALGRLKPGVTLAQARGEFAVLGQRMAVTHPEAGRGVRMVTVPLRDALFPTVPATFQRLSWAAALVLLIACANVANLLLARGTARQQEIAIRLAMGAGRASLLRVLLLEALVLSGAGAATGLALATALLAGFRLVIAPYSRAFPYFIDFNVDALSVAAVVGLALVTTLLAGLAPAWRAARTDPKTWLNDGGRGSTRAALSGFMRGLVIGEVALSCALLAGVGLMVRTALAVDATALGVDPAGVATGRFRVPGKSDPENRPQLAFARQLLDALEARPEIGAAALSWETMLDDDRLQVVPEGAGAIATPTASIAITGDYFRTLGIPLRSGRTFDGRDHRTAERVAIVNPVLAERFWPRENPLGKHFRAVTAEGKPPAPWITVVGVAAPTLQGRFKETISAQVYTPWAQQEDPRLIVVWAKARHGDAAALLPVLRQTLRGVDPDVPYWWADTFADRLERTRGQRSLWLPCYVFFGLVALVLSTVGLYGVMAYSVSRRTREIGVRMALGAQPRAVLGLIFRQGGAQVGWGLALGGPLAYACGRQLSAVLFAVPPHDWVTLVAVMTVLTLAGAAACLVPAWRALRVDPVEALRRD